MRIGYVSYVLCHLCHVVKGKGKIIPLSRWHSNCHIKRQSHNTKPLHSQSPGVGASVFCFAHRLRRMDAAIKLGSAPVLRILRLICSGDSPDSLTVTKKGLIDLVERLRPRGPSGVQRGPDHSGVRATYARKLGRALKQCPDLKLGTLEGDLHNEVYHFKVVEHVLPAFGFSLSEETWNDIVIRLGSLAVDGHLKKKYHFWRTNSTGIHFATNCRFRE